MKKIIFGISTLIFIILISAPDQFASERGLSVTLTTSEGNTIELYRGSYALIVGNSNYTNGWDPIPGAIRDVNDVARVLEKHGFNVSLKTDLNRDDFSRAMSEFSLKYGKAEDNRLLFYFAGHGYTQKMATNEELGYLVMANAPLPDKDLIGFSLCSVDMQSVVTQAKIIRARHVLFMFDSCFSGSIVDMRERIVPKSISDKIKYPVRQFITAGRADEPVPDQSVFKQAFLDLLEGRDEEPVPDKYITGEELGYYLKIKVPEYNPNQHPQYGKIRDPRLDKGDFVFVIKSPVQISQSNKIISELESEKKRLTEEAARIERELDQIKKLIAQRKKLEGEESWRLEIEKKGLSEITRKELETRKPDREKQKLASISEKVQAAKFSLRIEPGILTDTDINEMVEKYSFFDKERQPFGYFANNLIDNQNGTITDNVTGLMWQKSGSPRSLSRRRADSYVKKLNKDRFAGYSDWRLPTIEELASLLVFSKINNLHINPLFYRKQNKCWSADSLTTSITDPYQEDWIINFFAGHITHASWTREITAIWMKWYDKDASNYVRAVRSLK
ncbi:MAG: DUF1566 domain-containing protein [Desulfobacteraceae bacterium]